MGRDQIINVLKAQEAGLRKQGVIGVSLFGSVARGDASPGDVDLAVRLGSDFSKPGFAYFGRLAELERNLAAMLGCDVDVIEEPVSKKRFQAEIDRDRAIAF